MNREERRRLRRHGVDVDYIAERIRQEKAQADAAAGAEVMWACLGLVLHREFGFGRDRIMRAYEAIDREMKSWHDGDGTEATIRRLSRELKDEVGVEIEVENRG